MLRLLLELTSPTRKNKNDADSVRQKIIDTQRIGIAALTKFNPVTCPEASLEARRSLYHQSEGHGKRHQETGHHLRQAKGEADPFPAQSLNRVRYTRNRFDAVRREKAKFMLRYGIDKHTGV